MAEVGLALKREEGETWRDAALRVARAKGLEEEVREAYEGYIKGGDSEEKAARAACYDWDVFDVKFV